MFKFTTTFLTLSLLLFFGVFAIIGSGGGGGDGTGTPETETVEMLTDRSFEDNAGGNPDWPTANGHTKDFTNDQAQTGEYSGRIVSASTTEPFGYFYQRITENIPIGEALTLSAYIRTNLITGYGVSIAIRGDDTADIEGDSEFFETSAGDITINGTQDWTRYSITSSAVPAGIQSITVYMLLHSDTAGTVYFDDASMTYEQEVE